jgi:hypothetical protein
VPEYGKTREIGFICLLRLVLPGLAELWIARRSP